MIRIMWCLLFGHFLFAGIAQEPFFSLQDIGEFNAGVTIRAMAQDHQCMIWLGTEKGLARYDGTQAYQIPFPDTNTFFSVSALFEDKDFRIWVGTTSGRIFFMDETRKLKAFEVEEGNPKVPITAIRQDPQGYLWFSTYGEGAYVYADQRFFNISEEDGLSGEDVYDMDCTAAGEMWLGTDNGISICSFKQQKKSIRTLGLKDGLPDQIVTTLKADDLGNVWIGTFEFGTVYYNHSTRKIDRLIEGSGLDEVTALTLFDEGELWIGTRTSGVWRYHPGSSFAERINALSLPKHGQVTGLLTDVEGNIWVSMEGVGLMSGFRPFESIELAIPEIQAVFCDADNSVWIGTKEGLFLLSQNPTAPSEAVRILPQLPLNITTIVEDDFNHLWIGTLDQGLFVYDRNTERATHIGSMIGDGGNTIMSMTVSSQWIWMATLEGVVSYPRELNILNNGSAKFKLLNDPWQSNLHFVFQVFVDSHDRIWFASDGNGVFRIEGGQAAHFTGDSLVSLKTVYSICEDQQGHFWFNTPKNGLIEFDGEKYISFGLNEGLRSLNVAGMNILGAGEMLITDETGMTLLEPGRRHTMYYGEEIGVRSFEPGLNANSTSLDGHVYSSGRSTIFKCYSPKKKLSIHPRTQLTSITVFDKQVDFLHDNHFSHSQNYFSFHYVGLWYTSPASVIYLYKLDGYDRQWKESKDNIASYSNLAPGTYTFSVKASENNSFLDEPTATYTFIIAKPVWQKIWFIGLVVILGIAGFYWLVKSRERKSARQAMLRKDMIESQLTALKAQINPHFLFNSFNTLITIIDENPMKPELAVKYVEKLSDFYRSILQYREHETITLEEEWDLVKNYVYLLRERYGENLRLHIDPPPKEGFILPLTLQMLVENAVKHNVITEQYPLDLFISIEDGEYISVTNSLKPKAKPEPSTQFGLHTISSRYQLICDKKVVVRKNHDTFVVRIPIIKKSAI